MIIIPWTKSVEEYVALGPDVEYVRPSACPDCEHHELIFWGRRKRFVTDGRGSHIVFVRRVQCKGCIKTHTILPAFLLKRRTYLAEMILLVLILVFVDNKGSRAVSEKLMIARSTLRRWIDRFKESAAYHYRRFLFLKHNLNPDALPPPPSDYPKAALGVLAELFGTQKGGFDVLGRRVSLATAGCLLIYQPKAAP
jgi:hypothetical protein